MSGWPATPGDALACLCRDVLLPLLWVAAWFGNGFEWRGNAMSLNAISNAPGGHGLA
jgi:ceramide glucosyltransferase